MIKKLLICTTLSFSLASCSSLFQIHDGDRTGTTYQANRQDNTLPPTHPGSYNQVQHVGETGNHVQHVGDSHYNQPQHPQPGNHQGYNNRPDARRPLNGDIVQSLPAKGVKTVKVNGETLYLYNGYYYKPVRTNSGTAYKVVGSTMR